MLDNLSRLLPAIIALCLVATQGQRRGKPVRAWVVASAHSMGHRTSEERLVRGPGDALGLVVEFELNEVGDRAHQGDRAEHKLDQNEDEKSHVRIKPSSRRRVNGT